MLRKKKLINIKFKLFVFILSLSFFNYQIALGKQTKLIFKSTGNETVTIYTPIDNACNFFRIPSNEFKLSPETEIVFKPNILNFSFVQIQYSNGKHCSVLLHEGDSLQLNYDKEVLKFSGNNALGQEYLNNFSRSVNVDSIFDQHLVGGIQTNAINQDIKSLFFDSLNYDLNQLVTSGKISSEFGQKVYNDMSYAVADMFTSSCEKLLKGIRKVKLSQSDTLAIKNALDSIFVALPPNDRNIIRYRYSKNYISRFYSLQFMQLSSIEKNNMFKSFTADTFGPYSPFLLAPDYIQLPFLGSAFITQLVFAFDEFDKSKMYSYMQQKFSDSEYFNIIRGRYIMLKKEGNNTVKSSEKKINYLSQKINSLKDISSLPEFKGKYIYVDIWASWCIPCKKQFQYKEKLDSLAEIYDISLLYISIDKEEFKKLWASDIEKLGIYGYHMIANKFLLNDIKKNIYFSKTITIPRYILLDTKGNIINNDLPRPEAIDKLKEVFDKEMNFSNK